MLTPQQSRATCAALDAPTAEKVRADLESAIHDYGLSGERARLLRANVNHVIDVNGTQSAADYLAGARRYL